MMEPFHGTCNEISFCMVNGEWVWEFESTLSGNGLSTDGDTSIPLFNGKLILISICNAFSHGDLPSQDKVYQLEERNGSFENMQLVEGEITIYHTGSVNKSTKPTEDDLHSDGCLILRETGKFKNEKLIAGTRVRRADNNLYMHTMGDWDHTTNQFKGQLTQIHAENKVEYQGTFTCVSDAELRMLPTASHYTFKEYIHQSLIREEEGSFLDWKLEGLGSRTEYQTGPHESNKITTKGLFHTGVATTINMITSELITPSFLVNILYTFTSNDASLYTGKMVLQTKTPNLVMLKRARWSGTMRPRKEPGQFELIQGEAVITTYENGQATIEQLRRGDFEHPTQLHSLPSTKMPCQEETWRINGAERELISRATGTFVHGKLVRSFVPRPPPQARSAPLTATIQTNDLKATIDALLKDELIEKKRLRETKLFQKAEKERQADLMLRKEQEKKHEKQRLKAEEDQRLLNEKQQKKEIDASRSKQRNANRLTTADTTHVKSAPMDTIELDDIDEVFEPGSIAIPDTRPTPIPDWSALEIEPYVFSSPIETRTRNERTARMESTSNALDLPQTF